MNVRAHMSGQISGQVPNQEGVPQQNGNPVQHALMQNLGTGGTGAGGVVGIGGTPHNTLNLDPDLSKTREYMQGKIIEVLKLWHRLPITEASMIKFRDFARRLEEGLFKIAHTKEDYINLSTLEHRLQMLIKGSRNVRNQQHAQLVNSASAPVGTMIPTPGMSGSGNPSMIVTSSMSAANASIAPTTVNAGSLLPTGGMNSGSFSRSEGNISDGFQQSPANVPIASGGMPSIGVPRMTSQMIPTPGFNGNNNNSSINNQSSDIVGGLSTVESTMVLQPQQQKQHVGGQNSRILHTLGSQMGSSIRSGLQQTTFGFPNGSLNGASGMMGNNMQIVNEPGTSGVCQAVTSFANSSKPLQQHFDQHQRPLMQGDGYGINADSSGSRNLYGAVTSVGSAINSPNLNPINLQSMSRTNSLISNQLNLHGVLSAARTKLQSMDQFEKMNFQPSVSLRDNNHNILQANQQKQFQQQSHQFQQQQFLQQQHHQKQQNQLHQNLLSNSGYSQFQLASDIGNQVKSEPGVEHHDEVLHQQAPEPFMLPELQNQFQKSHAVELSSQQDMLSSQPQNSPLMQQILPQHQLIPESHNDYKLSAEALPESVVQSQWHAHSQDRAQMLGNISHEQHVQEDFRRRISLQDEAQHNNFSADGCIMTQELYYYYYLLLLLLLLLLLFKFYLLI